MYQTIITETRRRELCAVEGVTFDGRRAYISGVKNDYATITDDRGLSAEWSWQAVERIITTRGGAFRA